MYHPTGRVLTVLELLQSRPGITGREIADRMEVDVRTVRRYVEKLQDVGIPVEASQGRYGGYRLRAGFRLPPLVFTNEEALAIVLGLLASPRLGLDQSQAAIDAALSKITRVLPQDVRERVSVQSALFMLSDATGPQKGERPTTDLVLSLSSAIDARLPLRIEYTAGDGGTTDRVVEPYRLVGMRVRWYLIGYCRLRNDMRTFRLDRIASAETLTAHFVPNPDFDYRTYVAEHLETFTGFLPYAVRFFAPLGEVQSRVAGIAGELSEEEDGATFRARTDSYDYEARFLARANLPFVVLEPPQLRDAVRSLAARLLDSVRESGPTENRSRQPDHVART